MRGVRTLPERSRRDPSPGPRARPARGRGTGGGHGAWRRPGDGRRLSGRRRRVRVPRADGARLPSVTGDRGVCRTVGRGAAAADPGSPTVRVRPRRRAVHAACRAPRSPANRSAPAVRPGVPCRRRARHVPRRPHRRRRPVRRSAVRARRRPRRRGLAARHASRGRLRRRRGLPRTDTGCPRRGTGRPAEPGAASAATSVPARVGGPGPPPPVGPPRGAPTPPPRSHGTPRHPDCRPPCRVPLRPGSRNPGVHSRRTR